MPSLNGFRSLIALLAFGVIAPSVLAAGGEEAEELPETSSEEEEYEAFLESLQGLAPRAEVEALEDYLSRNPRSPHRAEIERRIEAVKRSPPPAWRPQALPDPLTFLSPVPRTRLKAVLSLGSPSWIEALGTFDYRFRPGATVGVVLGMSERVAVLEANGRYALLRRERDHRILSVGLGMRGELGAYSAMRIEPRIGYGQLAGPLQLQAFVGPRIRLAGADDGLNVQYRAGVAVGWPVTGRWWVGVESFGYLERVQALRTDLPELEPTVVGFFAATVGARYQVTQSAVVTASVSIPYWYRFKDEYDFAVTAGVEYRFAGEP